MPLERDEFRDTMRQLREDLREDFQGVHSRLDTLNSRASVHDTEIALLKEGARQAAEMAGSRRKSLLALVVGIASAIATAAFEYVAHGIKATP